MHGKANRNVAIRRVLEGEPVTKVAESLGIPVPTISNWVPSRGTKHAILMELAKVEETDDVEALAHRIGVDPHSVVHLLWALQKQRLVTFRESKRATGNGQATLIKVRLDGVAREALRPTLEEVIGGDDLARTLDALTPDPVLPPEEAPTYSPIKRLQVPEEQRFADRFPAIAALIERHRNLTEASRLAEEAGETELALTLLEKAEGSALEREIMELHRAARRPL